MAREEKNLDISTVVYETEIIYHGKKYTDPLYNITDDKTFEDSLELVLGYQVNVMSHPTSVCLHEVRNIISNHRLSSLPQDLMSFEYAVIHPQHFETTLDRAYNVRNELLSMRALYYACLDVDNSNYSDLGFLFHVLSLVNQYYTNHKISVESVWSFVPLQMLPSLTETPLHPAYEGLYKISEMRSKHITDCLKNLAALEPLCSVFTGFLNKYEVLLRQHEYRFNGKFNGNQKTSRTGYQKQDAPSMSCILHFWQSKPFAPELRELFWDYCQSLPSSDVQIILLQLDTKALAELILDALDRQLEDRLRSSVPTICTKRASVRWTTNNLETAEYLYLYSELVQRKKYRICPICGSLFALTAKYMSKRYCDRHDANQIQYYRRKMNEI